jgi:IS1 family transposase
MEGCSMRSTARITGASVNTVMTLFKNTGKACWQFHDEMVVDIQASRIQTDEIWAFIYAKNKNLTEEEKQKSGCEKGDAWTWIAMDADTKLIISWYCANRDTKSANVLMADLKSRLTKRVQLSSDGFKAYQDSVSKVFKNDIDFAQLVKRYERDKSNMGPKNILGRMRYVGADKEIITGNPNLKHVSTSYIERVNLTLRMHNRRFTRKTNAFSKKFENHCLSQAITFLHYNFIRTHQTLGVTPAMKAEIIDRPITYQEVAILAEEKKYNSN